MIIKLNKSELFWSLINPIDVEDIIVILNESTPQANVDFDKLPSWAKTQIESSIKNRAISADQVIALSATTNAVEPKVIEATNAVVTSKNKKKVSKKVTAKAI
ncbi:MAG: hypothetical protein PHY47_00430 [Lachnospiraceae bacterium]|nr:hypothetical protein [Lachnospiraceae bacterium]